MTQILNAVDAGDPHAAAAILPLVYDELRKLAARKMMQEGPGQTLDATGLVHEACLWLVGDQQFANRRHFFAAAAEAMRRILVDEKRKKQAAKRGGTKPLPLGDVEPVQPGADLDLLTLHDLLDQFAATAPRKAELVKLRYFVGCTLPEAAGMLDISLATAEKDWTYAKAWLRRAYTQAYADPSN